MLVHCFQQCHIKPMKPSQHTDSSPRDIFTYTDLHWFRRRKTSKGEPALSSNVELQEGPRIQRVVSFHQVSFLVPSLVRLYGSVSCRGIVIFRLCCVEVAFFNLFFHFFLFLFSSSVFFSFFSRPRRRPKRKKWTRSSYCKK